MRHSALFRPETPNEFPKLQRLYEMAKQDFWDESTVIDWDRPLDLPLERRRPLAKILSIVYYGERAALEVAAQLIGLVEDEECKFVLAAQVIEEAKHVSVFRRLLGRLDQIHPVNLWSRLVLEDLVRTRDPVAKMIGMQLIVENFANHLFKHLQDVVPDEHVREVLSYVQRDEKKHTGLAALYLPTLLAGVPRWRLPMILARQAFWSTCLERSVYAHRREAAILGIDLHDAMIKGIASQERLVEQIGSARGIWRSKLLEKLTLRNYERLQRQATK